MDLTKIAITIPALEPNEKMLKLIKALKQEGFEKIICVNDGSSAAYDHYFLTAENEYNCIVLKHAVNLGKGRALKTAFNYLCNNSMGCIGTITVDADGQHKPNDIVNCAKALLEHEDCLIMGCRNFGGEKIPLRNKMGNVLTVKIIKILCGITISDTQTGLRGISVESMKKLLKVAGEGFEYETNMLLYAKESGIGFYEVPIAAVYFADRSSHFNPLWDSIRIYGLFAKFIIASLSSFLVDIALFTLLVMILRNFAGDGAMYIAVATVIARIISGVYNYTVNKKGVFKLESKTIPSAGKYLVLWSVQCFCSALLVTLVFTWLHWNETVIKIIVDTILFFISFQIQREWVFKK